MKLTGDRNQCPTCGRYFNSTAAFEKHRTGDYSDVPDPRRCLSEAEMRHKGMRLRENGFWVGTEMPERAF